MVSVLTGEGPDPAGPEAMVRRVADLLTCEVDGLTDGELADGLLALDAVAGRLQARQSTLVDRWDARMVWAGDGARSAAAWLTARTEVSRQSAGWEVHQARMLRSMPLVAEAFQAGRLGSAKVRILVKGRTGVEDAFASHEEWLVARAEKLTVAHTAIVVATWRASALAELGDCEAGSADEASTLHLSQTLDGRWVLDATLDPEAGALIHRAIQGEVDVLFRRGDAAVDDGITPGRRRNAALVELVRRGIADGEVHGERRPTVILHVDHRTAGRDPYDGVGEDLSFRVDDLDGHGPVAFSIVQRMMCDADIVPVIVDGTGEVLDIGCERRTPTRAMRRALRARDRGCVFPGCDVSVDRCDAHHVLPWEWDGDTSLDNLVMLCRFHHHSVHEGGFVLTRELDRIVRVWRPDGTALPLARYGDQLFDDEPRPAPDPGLTREPADVAARREALRHPPPAAPGPSRFRQPTDVSRTRQLADLRNLAGARHDSSRLMAWITLDLARGRPQG